MSAARFDIDCAVIGEGIAGAYCHYRLACAGIDSVLFGQDMRIGGRLWALLRRGGGMPAELGGLSFSSLHQSIMGLAGKFDLSTSPLHIALGARLIRGHRFDASSEPRDLPYVLEEGERQKSAAQLLLHALQVVAPELSQLQFNLRRRERRKLAVYLRNARFEGALLSRWSFWTLLTRVLSCEAIDLARACFGSTAALGDINALDAIWALLSECAPGQEHYRFNDGFDTLPKTLAAAAGAPVRLLHRLERVERYCDGVCLQFATPAGRRHVYARRAILALPQRALASLRLDELISHPGRFARDLASVRPVGACKLYLSYERAWWLHAGAPDPSRVVASFTDQPLRQSYTFTPAPDETSALVMALYADDVAASYWSALAHGQREDRFRSAFRVQTQDVMAPTRVLEEARRQLARLNPSGASHEPNGAAFIDWSASPHNGAWHVFAPGVESWRVRERLRRPDPDLPLFICGEAFAELQGWAEGAVNNAEMMLERHFGVERPDWVDSSYPFEIEGTEK